MLSFPGSNSENSLMFFVSQSISETSSKTKFKKEKENKNINKFDLFFRVVCFHVFLEEDFLF